MTKPDSQLNPAGYILVADPFDLSAEPVYVTANHENIKVLSKLEHEELKKKYIAMAEQIKKNTMTDQSREALASAILAYESEDIEPTFTERAFWYLLDEAEKREINVIGLCEYILMNVAEQQLVDKIVG